MAQILQKFSHQPPFRPQSSRRNEAKSYQNEHYGTTSLSEEEEFPILSAVNNHIDAQYQKYLPSNLSSNQESGYNSGRYTTNSSYNYQPNDSNRFDRAASVRGSYRQDQERSNSQFENRKMYEDVTSNFDTGNEFEDQEEYTEV